MTMSQHFEVGQRVVVKEGYPGTILHEHTGVDTTSFYVLLDDEKGEGWWAENEMTDTSIRATAAHTAEVQRRMASDSYPELVGALEERPDLSPVIPEAEYMKSLSKMALYLPIDGTVGGSANDSRTRGYRDGYEQGKHGTYQKPVREDAEYMAEYHLGWAMGVKERGGVEPALLTQTLNEHEPYLPELKFDPDMGPGWLRSASLATEAGFVDFLMGSPDPSATWPGPGKNWSHDWCRFRRQSQCWLPRDLDRQASNLAGYAVWVPENRGHCKRQSWDEQEVCPVSQPGPNVPGGFTDATVSWSQGGQRDGVPTQRIASTDPDGFGWHYHAAWSDVQAKGKEIYDSGRVRILAVNMQADGIHPDTFYGQVQSTTGEVYEPGLEFVPGTFQLASWVCTCKWNNYVWGRTRQWVKYEGRICSHTLALVYEMQSRGMSGMPDSEDAIAPDWIPKHGSTVTREDFPVVQALLDTGASVASVQAALHRAGVETAKVGVKGTFQGKINGQVHTLEFDEGQVFFMGQPYDGPIQYPDYDRTLGLVASKQEDDMSPIDPNHMAFSVTASKGNDILGYVAYPEKKSEAQVQYANTPSYDEDSVPRGKNVHLGGGLWIRRCSQCDDYIKTWGQSPLWQPEFTEHLNAHGLDTSLAPLHSSVRDWQPGDDVMIGGNLWEVTGVGDDWLKVVPLDTYPDGAKIIAKPAPGEPLAIKPAPGRRDTTASVDKTGTVVHEADLTVQATTTQTKFWVFEEGKEVDGPFDTREQADRALSLREEDSGGGDFTVEEREIDPQNGRARKASLTAQASGFTWTVSPEDDDVHLTEAFGLVGIVTAIDGGPPYYVNDYDLPLQRAWQWDVEDESGRAIASGASSMEHGARSAAEAFMRNWDATIHESSLTTTAAAVFSRAEQDEIINEGEGVRAKNLASLDLSGTHYVPLDDLVKYNDDDADPNWLW